ncbi:MAG: carboxypeptidase regulatory-like domain-containing protein [Sphingopyxis sp.]|nr:carboxypeptidase regulatory-like domain-containing protein [Sphingopyxis sp.]
MAADNLLGWSRLTGFAAMALIGFRPVGVAAADPVSPPVPPGNDSWQANDDDQWLFDLRSGQYRLGDGVRGYQTPEGICVDLADMVIGLDLAVRIDKKLRRATGWLFDERRTLTLDRDAGSVRVGSRSFTLAPGTIRDTPEGWCIQVSSLAQWLELPLAVDQSNAILRLDTKEKLPFQLAAERRARAAGIRPAQSFDLAKLPSAPRPYKLWQTPSIDVAASLAFVNDKRGGRDLSARYEIFAAGELLRHSFDARLASDENGLPQSLRLRAYRSDPTGQLLGPLHATHYALGDVSLLATGLVSQSSVGRGAVVTNRPIERPESFDRTDFRGDLPAGWDAELYRNGQLLAFATPNAAGRYEFLDVALQYGSNRFEIVLYGPQGQVRREIKQLQVGMDSIPPRQTWYWAGIAEEDRDLINLGRGQGPFRRGWRGTVGIERGINARTSLAAYGHSLFIENVRRDYGEVAVRRAIGPTLLELSGAYASDGGSALRANWLAGFADTYIRVEALRGFGGFVSDRLIRGISGSYSIGVDQSVRLGQTILPLHFDLRHITRTSGVRSVEATARASVGFRRINLTGQVDWSRSNSPFGPDPPDQLTARLLANASIGRLRLRGEAQFALSGAQSDTRFGMIGEWSAGKDAQWRAELGYDGGLDRARAGLGYTRRFKQIEVTASGEAASDGSLAASLAVAFSLGPKAGGGVRASSRRLASGGQVEALVWQDRNADGIRQDDEPVMPGVELTAGTHFVDAATDADGRAMIDGLEPFRPVLIGIDAGSLPDPYVQPALPGVVVTPRPGVATLIALPLVAAGDIDGKLVRASGTALEGVSLELVDVEGRVRATTLSEFDGYFLFESVAFGRYTVRIAEASADAVRVDPTFSIAAAPGPDRPRARLGTLTLPGRDPPLARSGEPSPDPPPTADTSARGPPPLDQATAGAALTFN